MKKFAIGLFVIAMLAVGVAASTLLASQGPVAAQESQEEDPATEPGQQSDEKDDDANQRLDKQDHVDEVLAGLVADGIITQDQADAVAEAFRDAGIGRLGHKFGDFKDRHFGGFGVEEFGLGRFGSPLDGAAEALGLTEDELFEQLADGKTLSEVAEDQGVTTDDLIDALVASAEERIDAAVESGKVTEELALELKEKARSFAQELVSGELPILRFEGRFPGGGFDFDGDFPFRLFEFGPEQLDELEGFFQDFELPESLDELYEQFPELRGLHERLEERFGGGLPFFEELEPDTEGTGA